LWAASRNLPSILQFSAQNFESPLYLVILHSWELFFGSDIVFARLLSLLFFLGAIGAIYFLGKLSYDANHGLFVALVLTISAFMNWYANEARMYSLFALFTIL